MTNDNNGYRNGKRSRTDDVPNLDLEESSVSIKNVDELTYMSNDVLYQVLMNNNKKLDELKEMMTYLIDENIKFKSDLHLMKTAHDDVIDELRELKSKQTTVVPSNVEILSGVKEVQRSIQSLNSDSASGSVTTKPTAVTYATIAKSTSKVVIKPKVNAQDSIATKSAISEVVDPSKFPILNVRETKNGGLIIECKDKSVTDNFMKDVEQKLSANYDVTIPSGRTPKVKVVGMSSELTADKIMEHLLAQNNDIFSGGSFKVVQTFKMKKSFGAKLEVDGNVFKRLIDAGRVLIGWDSCVIHECFDLLRCYNCLSFHHTAKTCKSAKACIKCGLDHVSTNCQAETESCVNCAKAVKAYNLNINIGHNALSNSCMVYQRKLKEERSRVDYDFMRNQ